jgi:hypothetical protein
MITIKLHNSILNTKSAANICKSLHCHYPNIVEDGIGKHKDRVWWGMNKHTQLVGRVPNPPTPRKKELLQHS